MIRFLVRLLVYVLAAAIALLIVATFVNGFRIDPESFLTVVLIFALVQAILTPFFEAQTRRGAPALSGAAALLSTLVALIVTSAVTNGLTIDGLGTWIVATVVLWLVGMVAVFVLPFLLVKFGLKQARARRSGESAG